MIKLTLGGLIAFESVLVYSALGVACRDSTGPRDQEYLVGKADNASGMFTAVHVGDNSTCALDMSGLAYCWGTNFFGQLGIGDTAYRVIVPTRVLNQSEAFNSISVGSEHQCALTSSGRAYCWGHNRTGQLGIGVESSASGVSPVAGGMTFSSISAGGGYTCAITIQGEAYCWGADGYGELGAGSAFACDPNLPCSAPAPVPVVGGNHFVQITAGTTHACGVTTDGTAYCWGDNGLGQLGDPSVPIQCAGFTDYSNCVRDTPNPVSGGLKFAQLAAGTRHTCGLTTAGKAYCWGLAAADPTMGASGLGNAAYSGYLGRQRGSRSPVPVEGDLTFREITAANDVSCGLTTGGEAVCWGSNNYGQLGQGGIDPIFSTTPLAAHMPTAQHAPAIGVDDHACALTTTGRVWCWGGVNWFGELGSEPMSEPLVTMILRALPTPVDASR